MQYRRWLYVGVAAMFALASGLALAQGHGRGHEKHDRDDDDDQGRHYYSDHDRDEMRRWYHDHDDDLPPGLAKRDQLPPGLEKQLVERGTLPPGLRKKLRRCPEDLERRLPPPPPHCEHAILGGHVVLVNTQTFAVLDIFHFELR